MKTLYDALREVLQSKEQEIKRLEKEIDALRVVLPIVAETKQSVLEDIYGSGVGSVGESSKAQPFTPAELNAVFAQATSGSGRSNQPQPETKPKASWP